MSPNVPKPEIDEMFSDARIHGAWFKLTSERIALLSEYQMSPYPLRAAQIFSASDNRFRTHELVRLDPQARNYFAPALGFLLELALCGGCIGPGSVTGHSPRS
jgi:hypothetical protein